LPKIKGEKMKDVLLKKFKKKKGKKRLAQKIAKS
jgi:hypothetical protein